MSENKSCHNCIYFFEGMECSSDWRNDLSCYTPVISKTETTRTISFEKYLDMNIKILVHGRYGFPNILSKADARLYVDEFLKFHNCDVEQ